MIEPSQRLTETQRVRNAFKDGIEELTRLQAEPKEIEGQKIKDIFAVHLSYLRDRTLRKKITDIVNTELVTA